MTLSNWVKEKLGVIERCPRKAAVLALADEVDSASIEVRKHLDEYLKQSDPFTALAVDVYKKHQEANMWRGPPK